MTRIAILSDIHANLRALQAVFADLATRQVDQLYCLGDFVVYGPLPQECLALVFAAIQEPGRSGDLAKLDAEGIARWVETFNGANDADIWASRALMGNNDFAIADNRVGQHVIDDWVSQSGLSDSQLGGADSVRRERIDATQVSHDWTRQILSQAERMHLGQLSKTPLFISDEVMLVHASPCEEIGMEGDYLRESQDAEEAFYCLADSQQSVRICFFGHTHRAVVFEETTLTRPYDNCKKTNYSGLKSSPTLFAIGKQRLIINPGSVGQPRDGDPRAAYVIYDSEMNQIEFYRVKYNVADTIQDWTMLVDSNPKLKGVKEVMSKRLEEGR